jgi:hypothetical protein
MSTKAPPALAEYLNPNVPDALAKDLHFDRVACIGAYVRGRAYGATLAESFDRSTTGAANEPPVPNVQSASDHVRARAVLLAAFRQVMKREPTAIEIQAVQAIALHETGYGKLAAFPGSHNWGGVQIPGTWGASECPEAGLLWKDSHPKPDGTDVVQSVCFRSYPDDVTGAIDLVRNVTKARPKTLAALATGDADQIAAAMYAEHYYEGHGKTPAERVAGYAKGLARRAAEIAPSLGEPVAVLRTPSSVVPAPGERVARRPAPEGGRSILPLAALLGVMALAGDEQELAAPISARHARSRPVFAGHTEGLGDLLPTFVTPDDARRYVNETDAEFERLDQAIQTSQVSAPFKQSWVIDRDAWRKFRDDALKNVGWFNTKATMDQTDRWKKKASDWHDAFTKEGGQTVGPAPAPPAQGLPPPPSASSGWVQLALMIAGLFGLGYLVRGFRGAA